MKVTCDTVTGQIEVDGYPTFTDITVGGTTFKNIPIIIATTPVTRTSKHIKNDFSAVLGRPFVSRVKVTLNYKNMVARFSEY